MKLYLASTIQNGFYPGTPTYNRLDPTEKGVCDHVPYRLDSYHYIGSDRMADRVREGGMRVFLDSGAFSAYTQGVEIDIQEYIGFCRNNLDVLEYVSVLDSIGDADKTYENQRIMEIAGLAPLPCFHYGEPEGVVDHYANNYEYITLGGMVPISNRQLIYWLDHIWDRHLTHPDGTPKVKVHGFGLTSKKLMERYPWYSVDSSAWVQLGGMGNVHTIEYGTLAVDKSSKQVKEPRKHIDTLTELEHRQVAALVKGRGFELERLQTNHLSRKVFNAWTYVEMAHKMASKELKFIRLQPVLF